MYARGMDVRPALARCEECSLRECVFVPGDGPARADLVIVGEAPGDTEVRRGRPFAGPAGKLLDRVLREAGIDRSECYVTNSVLCRPDPHRPPKKSELDACRERLLDEIRSRGPKVVLALGNPAIWTLLRLGRVTEVRGAFHIRQDLPGVLVMPSIHPAAILRGSPDQYRDLLEDVKRVAEHLRGLPGDASLPPLRIEVVDTDDAAEAFVTRFLGNGFGTAALDCETASDGSLLSAAVAYQEAGVTVGVFLAEALWSTAFRDLLRVVKIVAHDAKADQLFLLRNGLPVPEATFDTLLAHYVLDERQGKHGLKDIVREEFGDAHYADVAKKYLKRMEECPRSVLVDYNARDAYYTWLLYERLSRRLGAEDRGVLEDILLPVSGVLMKMEARGTQVDRETLERLEAELGREMMDAYDEMARLAGFGFNPNSHPQRIKVLYETLQLPKVGKSPANEATLEKLSEFHPLPKKMLEYRRAHKLLSVYVRGLRRRLDEYGRVHTRFNVHGTVTGRLSSSGPNLQNVPRPDTDGGRIRNLFVATPGWKLVNADFSQIELRVLALLSGDDAMVDAFTAGQDIHLRTACDVFGKAPEAVTKAERTRAKTINFAVLYGADAPKIAQLMKAPVEEARPIIRRWFEARPGVARWIEETRRFALEHGYVVTPFGRKRRFGFIPQENRAEALRQAVNFVIQSTASDVTLLSLIRLDGLFDPSKTRLLLTVHDSILVETREDPEEAASLLKGVMEDVASELLPGIPFLVETAIGDRWGDL